MRLSTRQRVWTAATIVALVLAFLASLAFLPARRTLADQNGTKVMPLGDSITYGSISPDGGGYRTPLWHDYVRNGYNVNFVGSQSNGPSTIDTDHEGHPGYRIDEIASNVVNWLTTYQPQVVLLHIGTNDIIQNHDVSTAPDRLSSLIDQITTTVPNVTVIVAQIIPVANADQNAEVVTYNNAIPGIVQSKVAQGQHVYTVDMYDVVPISELADGLHPGEVGYTSMATVWYNKYASLFAPNTTPLLVGAVTSGFAGKCLDIRQAQTGDGTPVQIWDCNKTNAQLWTTPVTGGTLQALGKCLDVQRGGTTNGTLVQLWTCNGTGAQQWVVSNGGLKNPQSGRCLDDPGGTNVNGTQLQIWDCNGTNAQKWTLPN